LAKSFLILLQGKSLMTMKRVAAFAAALALTLTALSMMVMKASADKFKAGEIVIDHPWARPTLGNVKNAAAYFMLDNKGKTADRLIGVKTDIAARAEIHETVMKDGYAKMAPLAEGLGVAAESVVALEPRGKHIMLFGVKQKLEAGQSFPLTLVFEKQGEVAVVVKIENPKDAGAEVDHSKHGGGEKKMDHSKDHHSGHHDGHGK
jgi:periplasmic copper chaperone A